MELNNKTGKRIMLLIAFAALLYWGLNNLSLLGGLLKALGGLLSPLLIGICIAFVLNLLLKALERLWDRALAKWNSPWRDKLKRGVCLTLTMVLFLGVIFAIIFYLVSWFSGLVCHARQCGLSDYYRQIHLFFVKGKAGSELDNSKQQQALYDSTPWKGNILQKLFLRSYVNYTSNQEKQTPQFQRLMAGIKTRYGAMEKIPQDFKDEFRNHSLPIMKWANILTFNTRAIALYIFCLIDLPWAYILFEIVVMTSLYFYMRHTHENFCRRLKEKYSL